ncbi:hypothetical protein VTJ49DRAFT_1181 [Mycothermus thermophilus]|uniref:UmuC domain-containing protein n=1 Tax=Humicola insolens TaxID=85995 RepID=A0ABR3VDJ1_HUMIN
MEVISISNAAPPRRRPGRHHDRVILHIDLDCFYAQCVENRQPSLRSLPLGIKQKGILATCNYVARRHGVKKLMPIAEARRICPDLVLADGEDLSPFRDVSKRLYSLVRSHSWNGKVERLGLDEIFVDASDIISYNAELLNPNALAQSWFCLSRPDPEVGFEFDATSFAGCVHGVEDEACQVADPTLRMRLLLGSHLARYLRMKIEEEGYTSSCGIATNKLLAKLAGDKNKPQNQTTLLTPSPEDVLVFMDPHPLRKVPGIGSKIARLLQGFVLDGASGEAPPRDDESGVSATVGQVRTHPAASAPALERLLAGPGAEKGIGRRVWALLHGLDDTDVKPGRDVPTQISIEDSFKGGLTTLPEIRQAMVAITASLLRRIRVDLLVEEGGEPGTGADAPAISETKAKAKAKKKTRWLACPRTIRLSTRPYTNPAENKPYNFARASRSAPLPSFVFSALSNNNNNSSSNGTNSHDYNSNTPPLNSNNDTILHQTADRLVTTTLLPLFHKLNPPISATATSSISASTHQPLLRANPNTANQPPKPEGNGMYNIGLINICVTNMSGAGAANSTVTGGGGITELFRRQEEWLAGFQVVDGHGCAPAAAAAAPAPAPAPAAADRDSDADDDDYQGGGGCRGGQHDLLPDTNPKPPPPNPGCHALGQVEGDLVSPGDVDSHGKEEDEESRMSWEWDDDDDNGDDCYDTIKARHGDDDNDNGGGGNTVRCPLCERVIPLFAVAAHERYHALGEE